MPAIQAVIIDFDGTLLDSYAVGLRHLAETVKRNGLTITPEAEQQIHEQWGHSGIELFETVFGLDREKAQKMYLEWEQLDLDDPIPLVAGAHDTLTWLREQKCPVCMLTSRHRFTVMEILKRERLQNYFACITAREDSNFCKPDGRAFTRILQCLARQNILRKECLFVGDTHVDIEAGRNAELRTVVVETGPYRHGHDKTHPVEADRIIPSIAHLPAWSGWVTA